MTITRVYIGDEPAYPVEYMQYMYIHEQMHMDRWFESGLRCTS